MHWTNQIECRTRALEQLKIPIWLFDVSALRIVWANPFGLTLWDSPNVDELRERDMAADITPSVRERLLQHRQDLKHSGKNIDEHWTFYPNGQPQSYECVVSCFDMDVGEPLLMIHALKKDDSSDIDTLYRANALLHTSVLVSVYNNEGKRVYANPVARRALSDGARLAEHYCDTNDWLQTQYQLEQHGRHTMEARVHTEKGIAWHSLTLETCPDPVSGEHTILVSEIDVTERRVAQDRVHELAYNDALTGLPNRSFLYGELNDRIQKAHALDQKFAVFFIDLDRFKLINDSLGHHVGDQLLCAVALRLKGCLSEYQLIARLGGDEFTVLTSYHSKNEVTSLAVRICDNMRLPIEVEGRQLIVTPSIGISFYPDHGKDQSSLMRTADLAMYTAKAEGGGHCIYTNLLDTNSRERLQIETDIRSAVLNDEFQVYYQPKVNTLTRRICGMEALVRWLHPEKGIVPPLKFISVAEETDLISDITRFVLFSAMRQQCRWQALGHELSIAINISPREFRSGDIVKVVEEALSETGCDPKSVELEITESMLMADGLAVNRTLNSMKSLGIKLSIDDFGTGYSNLGYLQKFPIDSLKIDRSFIADPDCLAVLRMIIEMGKMLSLTVVAEGVETNEQLLWLIEQGCDQVQGFLFSPPVDAASATKYLESHEAWINAWPKRA